MELQQKIAAAAEYILSRIPRQPRVGLVLGSGLGDFADTLDDPIRIPFAEIPGFLQTSVAGHKGALVFGRKNGRYVAVLQGRIHYYEGHSQREITLPIRVLSAIGVKTVVLTNAAGGINKRFKPGDLMLICDHINFSGSNPLIGPNLDDFGPRFPDVSDLYDAELRQDVKELSAFLGIPLWEGVYLMTSGPNYETPAEIRMFRTMGADAVGMSTVPEALVAAHCGMKVVGISCITNMAAGILPQKLDHSEVVDTAAKVRRQFQDLISNLVMYL